MSESDLIGLFIESSQALDSNFEFFLTVSFALLVASYLVTERIPFPVFLMTIFLYFVATILFMIRGATMGQTLTSLRNQLDAMDSQTAIIGENENYLVAGLYFVIMVIGSVSTCAFVYWRYRRLRSQGDT